MFLYIICVVIVLLVLLIVLTYKVDRNKQWGCISDNYWVNNRDKFYRKKEKYKCCVISGDNRDSDDISMIKEINQKYCDVNGYEFIFFDKDDIHNSELNTSLPPYWWKVKMVYDVMLKSDYDYLMWIDSDACFHDHKIRMESVLGKNKIFGMSGDTDVYKISENFNFTGEFNAGVWIVKNCRMGKKFIKKWLDCYDLSRWYRKGDKWSCKYYFLPCMWAGTYYEQGSGYKLMHTSEFSKYISQLHFNILQGYKEPNKSSYTIHFCGNGKKFIKNYYKKYHTKYHAK